MILIKREHVQENEGNKFYTWKSSHYVLYKGSPFWHIVLCFSFSIGPLYLREKRVKTQSCYRFANKLLQICFKLSAFCVRTACSMLLQQIWNKLLTTCNKLDGIIRLVPRFFHQVWYSLDITTMLQGWRHRAVSIVISCTVYLLELRIWTRLLQNVNSLLHTCWQTCYKLWDFWMCNVTKMESIASTKSLY